MTYDILTQQNARKTLQRLTGIEWSTWQYLNRNYNKEQFLSDEDYVKRILDKEDCFLPAFRELEFTFGHITTSSTACESIRNGGLMKLACTNKVTELGLFLSNHDVDINIEQHTLKYNGRTYDISFGDCPPVHNREEYAAWRVGRKLYYDYCICGFLSYSKQPYGGYIHKRPEILKDMDELLNTDLATEWVATHTPYEIVVRVSADKIVYDGRNSDSEQEKVMNYLMKAYWCSFSDMENVILLKNDVEIQICDILNIRPFNMWR